MESRPLWKRLWYNFMHFGCRLVAVLAFRVRVAGREHLPSSGGLLVCCNHQSHLDPMLVGLALDRRLNFLARETLFRFAPFRWLIQSLDAIPLDREGLGLAGIKETLRRLKREEAVLIFPEGTRSADGEIGPLKPGFIALARRGKVNLLPMAVAGSFDAMPRNHRLLRPVRIQIVIGPPLSSETMQQWDDEALLAEVERRMRDCHQQARALRRNAGSLGSQGKTEASTDLQPSERLQQSGYDTN